MHTLDLNKPLRIIQSSAAAKAPKIVELLTVLGQQFLVANPAGKNYWLVNLDGSIVDHPAWYVENCPPPPVTHTTTLIWYYPTYLKDHGSAQSVTFRSKDAADSFELIVKTQGNFVARQEVSITV